MLSAMSKAKSTGHLLKQLRDLMHNVKYVPEALGAYIVPSADAHGSEYMAECDKRRAFISGFTGSAGTAIVTNDKACMWTDGRYYLQATEEMDDNWTLMKEGESSTPTQEYWLSTNLPSGSVVGVDPTLMNYAKWVPLRDYLEQTGHKLVPVETNLIDLIWKDQPAVPSGKLLALPIKYSGKSISDKLRDVRLKMKDHQVNTLVLTFLDEIAWMLNLRGSDIEYNPVFFAYVTITEDDFSIFIDEKKVTDEILEHLRTESGGNFKIQKYTEIKDAVKSAVSKGRIWISRNANTSLVSLVPKHLIYDDITPVNIMKAIKNPIEINGMQNAHIRDGVALCSYLHWLENNVQSGTITEISGSEKLLSFRAEQKDFMGPSFESISASGPHGAIIHYNPTKDSDVVIRHDALYLIDSGGQYKDGTTDVTRTVHFGTPTDYEKECFTLVLKGQINMGEAKFPKKIRGNCLDSFARQHLWNVGLDYAHGTGHGVGSFLCVHEGPISISWRHAKDDPGLEAGMFVSNEPGYYEDGKFGIRIEDIVMIVDAQLQHNFNNRGFLKFETVTMCPIQTKLIKPEMLTKDELQHVNDYHKAVRAALVPALEQQNKLDVKDWLLKETEELKL